MLIATLLSPVASTRGSQLQDRGIDACSWRSGHPPLPNGKCPPPGDTAGMRPQDKGSKAHAAAASGSAGDGIGSIQPPGWVPGAPSGEQPGGQGSDARSWGSGHPPLPVGTCPPPGDTAGMAPFTPTPWSGMAPFTPRHGVVYKNARKRSTFRSPVFTKDEIGSGSIGIDQDRSGQPDRD